MAVEASKARKARIENRNKIKQLLPIIQQIISDEHLTIPERCNRCDAITTDSINRLIRTTIGYKKIMLSRSYKQNKKLERLQRECAARLENRIALSSDRNNRKYLAAKQKYSLKARRCNEEEWREYVDKLEKCEWHVQARLMKRINAKKNLGKSQLKNDDQNLEAAARHFEHSFRNNLPRKTLPERPAIFNDWDPRDSIFSNANIEEITHTRKAGKAPGPS